MNTPAKQNGNGAAANVASIIGGRAPMPRSEATQVEQSRAIAEVQAMVTVAQARPRDVTRAMEQMRQSCAMMGLAERAFFKFPRGGQSVSGKSIHLAVELARCWGNVNYGIRELSRDDLAGQSEMLAFAWDVETNARADTSFIVPHKRDKRGGAEALTDMRDIYENNANNGARRLREMIFRIMPPWYREKAAELCHETLQRGEGDEPLPVRIANMVAAFADIGIGRDRIEARVGSVDKMTAVDLANMIVSFKSIKTGEISKDEEFPPLTAGQVGQLLNPSAPTPTSSPEGGAKVGQTAADAPAAAAGSDSKPEATGQPAPTSTQQQASAEPQQQPPPPQEKPKKDWTLPPGVVGQEKKLAAIYAQLDGSKCQTPDDVDDLWEFHEAFLDKLGTKKAEANHRFGDRKISLAQAQGAQAQ